MRREFAPAKVNLFLHVAAAGPDGRHPLCSLVVFADVGDWLEAEPGERYRLEVGGPFADQIGPASENLVTRALTLVDAPPVRITLTKNLPAAAGLGGGSSDAGAALRLAGNLFESVTQDRSETAARILGADGLMCLAARACLAEGEGDQLSPVPRMPALPAILVNPGTPSPTGAVYRTYDEGRGRFIADRPAMPSAFRSVEDVAAFLSRQRNDLEAPAVRLEPAIRMALMAVREQQAVLLTRMSGSGATVFGVFATDADARSAAERLRLARPDWWVQACRLNS